MTGRDRIVVVVILVAAVLGGYWFLLLAPKRKEAAELGKKVAEQQKVRDEARTQASASRAARDQYPVNYATVARLGKAVPVDDDVPSLVFQLESTARQVGVDFRSVKLVANSSGAAPPATAAAAASSTQDSKGAEGENKEGAGATAEGAAGTAQAGANASSSASSATSAAGPAAPATQAATASLPPGAQVGPAGFPTMPFSFGFEGNFFRLSRFFSRVERFITARSSKIDVAGRLLVVNGISLTAGAQGFPRMKASVSATAYLLPANEGLTAGGTPTAPPPAGSAQPVNGTAAPAPAAPAPATATGVR